MKLLLENIEDVVRRDKLLEVQNAKLPERGKYVVGSLWDENIFGKSASKDRKTKFAYIDLKSKYIHPAIFKIIQTSSQEISQVLNNKGSYAVRDGKLVPDEYGETGIAFFLKEFQNLDFIKMAKKEKLDDAKFIEKNRHLVFIDKWLVIPPSPMRDIDVFKDKGAGRSSSEINDYYSRLIYLKNTLIGDDLLDSVVVAKIQTTLNSIYTFVINSYFKGKRGIYRSKIMKKTID